MSLQARRHDIITKIITTLEKAKNQDKDIDKEKLACHVSFEYSCTLRMAKEYIKVAEGNL